MSFDLFGFFKKKREEKTPAGEPDPGDRLGSVEGYYRKPGVAAIRLEKGGLKQDDEIWVKGHTTDFRCKVTSLQIDHQPVTEARKGQCVGIKVAERARRGDQVYRVG